MIKCTIDGERRDLESKPVSSDPVNRWWDYRTIDHFGVYSLPVPPDVLEKTNLKITTGGHTFVVGEINAASNT